MKHMFLQAPRAAYFISPSSLTLLTAFVVALATASGCARVGEEAAGSGGAGGASGMGGIGGVGGVGGGAGTFVSPFGDGGVMDLAPNSKCGDGVISGAEQCEDGNTMSNDGCSSSCRVETNHECLNGVGKPCTHIVVCGDHRIDGDEACDDGNKADGDGCAADCKSLECGWECPPMAACRAVMCGDGKLAGKEQCDDGNATAGDGCSPLCQLESRPAAEPEGWLCKSMKNAAGCTGPTTCTKTTCGDKKIEGSEQCDDMNTVTGDGCSPFCRLEPICPAGGGACATACGDGLLLPIDKTNGQECDDGNTIDGDGCSSKCKEEPGFKCKDVSTKPDKLVLPVIYHDFKGWNEAGGHVDFQHFPGNGRGYAGIAQPTLGPAGVPVHVAGCFPTPGAGYPSLLTANGCPPGNANPTWDPAIDWFGMWYVDNATYNKTVVSTLTLPPMGNGAFQYSSDEFYPIGMSGWGYTPGYTRNYGFTSIVRTWFEYTGTASLSFYGDDDVWVYLNKKLAVDLGGTHQQARGSVTLDAANGHGYVCDFVAPGNAYPSPACSAALANGHDVDFGLKVGSVYEIVVFQAERFTTESNYQLTLSGFTGIKSSCESQCGDGVVTVPETCDLGAAMNNGSYGGCNADCTLAPYCGDKIVTAPEQCDTSGNCDKNCKTIIPI
jgi:fibro-slime domain-containing protein